MLRAATALAAGLLAASCACAQAWRAEVTHVSDGDTLWVRVAGERPRALRLRGIDAPEICQSSGPQARDALAAQVLHRTVEVRSTGTDDYGRQVAEVRHEGADVGERMVREGHAWASRFRGNRGTYARAEASARNARRGLWAGPAPESLRAFRQRHGRCDRRPTPR
jgi:micrococcal nuclease